MLPRRVITSVLTLSLLLPGIVFSQAAAPGRPYAAPREVIDKIKDEGMNRSQVMTTLRYLTDVIGPRLTNSPAQRRANEWTRDKLTEWGMQNAKLESWGPFGRGWEIKKYSASLEIESKSSSKVENRPFHSYPKAWSPGTNGPLTADVVFVEAATEEDLAKYKGQLKGKIILTADQRAVSPGFNPTASRRDEKDLLTLADAHDQQSFPQLQPTAAQQAAQRLNAAKTRLYYDEGAALLIDSGFGVDSGTIRVMGASVPPPPAGQPPPSFGSGPTSWGKTPPAGMIPQVVASVEEYNRVVRLLKQGIKVRMTVDLGVQFYEDDLNGYNTTAEIPGSDLKDEVVIIGAHLDSWHSATGSTDNATGSAVMMEAMRILKTLNMQPRRTIRIALWTGEEQGLWGSRVYVMNNYATIGDGSPASMFGGPQQGPRQINKKPDYDKISAYYNLDNGTGKIRGVYMQGNEGVRPYFREWLQPFKEMGMTTLTIQPTGGTDHVPFDAVGIPGFQFIQDPVEYFTRTWHTTQDVSDRVVEDDLKQSATIIAAFAYQTAMMGEKLPRKTVR